MRSHLDRLFLWGGFLRCPFSFKGVVGLLAMSGWSLNIIKIKTNYKLFGYINLFDIEMEIIKLSIIKYSDWILLVVYGMIIRSTLEFK